MREIKFRSVAICKENRRARAEITREHGARAAAAAVVPTPTTSFGNKTS